MADMRLKGFVTLSTRGGNPILIAVDSIESLHQGPEKDGVAIVEIAVKGGDENGEYLVQGSLQSVVDKIANSPK